MHAYNLSARILLFHSGSRDPYVNEHYLNHMGGVTAELVL